MIELVPEQYLRRYLNANKGKPICAMWWAKEDIDDWGIVDRELTDEEWVQICHIFNDMEFYMVSEVVEDIVNDTINRRTK
jgi:hypothetical protein|tara:strand:- start:374 stop:613 length:240 start_codon:yes stop_codon:yes gene_type:complete